MNLWLVMAVLLAAAGVLYAAQVEGLDFKAFPPIPRMAVSPTARPPTIDGRVEPGEWDDACAVATLQRWGKTLADPPTVAYVTYDAKRIYFAFRCIKEKPQWYGAKNRFRDSQVYLDPDVELYLSPDNADGKTFIYQFCFNAYGAIYDVRVMPDIGLTEPGYNPKIQLATTQTQESWTVEGTIDIADLDPRGFKDGQVWRANFVRSWPQRAWSLRGGPYIARDAMGELVLRADAPAVQWLNVDSLHDGKLDLQVAILNKTDRPQRYELTAAVTGETADQKPTDAAATVELAAGQRKVVRLTGRQAFDAKRGHAHLRITGGGQTWYEQVVRFDQTHAGAAEARKEALKQTMPVPREMSLTARYGQLSNALEVQADVWSLRRAGQTPHAVQLTVGPDPSPLATRRLTHFQKDLAITLMQLPADLPFGKHTVHATALDAQGKEISSADTTFERIDLKDSNVNRPRRGRPGRILDWIGSQAGIAPGVLPPWTPVRAAGPNVQVWGRNITLAPSGLPSQITSQGAELLAGPVTLNTTGGALSAKKPVAARPNVHASQAEWQSQATFDGVLDASISGVLEYDGLMRFTVKLAPRANVDRLWLDIPIKAQFADRMLLPTGMSRVPGGEAGQTVWESRSVRDDEVMGTLVPFIWLGNLEGGLTWSADHTRGWIEKPGESAVTLVRGQDGVVHIRVHLVQEAVDKPGDAIEFALLATPTKPLPDGWRNYALTDDWNYFWFTGWFGLQEKDGPRPKLAWDDPPAELMAAGLEEARSRNQRTLCLPYNNPQFTVPHPMPWAIDNTSPTVKLLGEDWANIPSRWGPVKPVASYRDWAADTLAWWISQQGYGGFYIDEAYGSDGPDVNLLNGSGWFDRHGNLRGSYHTMDTRQMLKRMYTISHVHARNGRAFLLVHTSSFGLCPLWTSYATACCSGEGDWEVHIPGQGLLDRLTPEAMEMYCGKAFGYMSTFFGDKMKGDATLIAQSRRLIQAELMLYDMLPNSRDGDAQAAAARKIKTDFGIGEGDVRFHGYWMKDVPVRVSAPRVLASVYRRAESALVVVVNTSAEACEAQLSLEAPLRSAGAADAETGQVLAMDGAKVSLKMEPRGARWVVIKQEK